MIVHQEVSLNLIQNKLSWFKIKLLIILQIPDLLIFTFSNRLKYLVGYI